MEYATISFRLLDSTDGHKIWTVQAKGDKWTFTNASLFNYPIIDAEGTLEKLMAQVATTLRVGGYVRHLGGTDLVEMSRKPTRTHTKPAPKSTNDKEEQH